jgi:hypothetical protein
VAVLDHVGDERAFVSSSPSDFAMSGVTLIITEHRFYILDYSI